MNTLYLLALVNAGLCGIIVFIGICRLNAMQRTVLWRVRVEYATYIGGASLSAMQPWWGEWPQWGSVAVAIALLAGLMGSSKQWCGDRAPPTATMPAELRTMDGDQL